MMADMNNAELERLVLAYEELDEDEKRQADEFLAERPDLRRRLESLRHIESAAAASYPFDDEAFWNAGDLTPDDVAAQQRSLADLRESLGLTVKPDVSFWNRGRIGLSLLIPVAAVLAFLVVTPIFRGDPSLIRDLSIQSVALDAGGVRSGTGTQLEPGVLRSGEAFALDFHLHEDAYVLAFHIDPGGVISLVHPPSGIPMVTRGGGNIRFPAAESGEKWILGGQAGTETFVLAVMTATSYDPDDLARAGKLAGGKFPDVAGAVDYLVGSLSETMDQVKRIEFQHID